MPPHHSISPPPPPPPPGNDPEYIIPSSVTFPVVVWLIMAEGERPALLLYSTVQLHAVTVVTRLRCSAHTPLHCVPLACVYPVMTPDLVAEVQ